MDKGPKPVHLLYKTGRKHLQKMLQDKIDAFPSRHIVNRAPWDQFAMALTHICVGLGIATAYGFTPNQQLASNLTMEHKIPDCPTVCTDGKKDKKCPITPKDSDLPCSCIEFDNCDLGWDADDDKKSKGKGKDKNKKKSHDRDDFLPERCKKKQEELIAEEAARANDDTRTCTITPMEERYDACVARKKEKEEQIRKAIEDEIKAKEEAAKKPKKTGWH